MTAWIPDVVPDELIESAWGNSIRDRTVTPFANAAARDAAITTPKTGMVCWLTDHAALFVYDGTAWRTLPRGRLAAGSMPNSDNLPGANVVRISVPFTLAATRLVKAEALGFYSIVTANANGNTSLGLRFDGAGTDIRLAAALNLGTGQGAW